MKKLWLLISGILALLAVPNAVLAASKPLGFCSTSPFGTNCVSGAICRAIDPTLIPLHGGTLCLPYDSSDVCTYGNSGVTSKCDSGDICATIQSLKDTSNLSTWCVNSTYNAPQPDSTNEDLCSSSTQCKTDEQCVRVWVLETGGSKTVVQHQNRCVARKLLPNAVLESQVLSGGLGGADCSSGQENAKCESNQICVETHATHATGDASICYKNSHLITSTECSAKNIGDPCGPAGNNGHCYNIWVSATIDTGYVSFQKMERQLQCLDDSVLTNSASGISTKTCGSDAECPDSLFPRCILNPITGANQCLAAGLFLSAIDPKAPADDPACAAQGKKSCNSVTTDSICTKYFPSADKNVLACISWKNAGEAYNSGAATPVANLPERIDTAEERNFRVSPQLEVDIPGLKFTTKINGQDVDGGKNFSIPFLAQYINGVYRYSIGLGVLIALVLIIVAGFRWMVAAGNAQKIGDAKKTVTNSILGLALLFSAYSLIEIINPQILQLKSLNIIAPEKKEFWVDQTGFDTVTDGVSEDVAIGSIEPGKFPHFKQCAKQWASYPYLDSKGQKISCSYGTDNICKSGCGVVATAEVLAYYGLDAKPPVVADWAAGIGAHNTCSGGTSGQTICKNINKKFTNITCKSINGKDVAGISQYLKKNIPVIFSCHGCSGTTVSGGTKKYKAHYMVITGVNSDGTSFAIDDVGNAGAAKNVVSLSFKEFTEGRTVNAFVLEKK